MIESARDANDPKQGMALHKLKRFASIANPNLSVEALILTNNIRQLHFLIATGIEMEIAQNGNNCFYWLELSSAELAQLDASLCLLGRNKGQIKILRAVEEAILNQGGQLFINNNNTLVLPEKFGYLGIKVEDVVSATGGNSLQVTNLTIEDNNWVITLDWLGKL